MQKFKIVILNTNITFRHCNKNKSSYIWTRVLLYHLQQFRNKLMILSVTRGRQALCVGTPWVSPLTLIFIVKVWFHFTLWVARSRPHLNIIIFLPYTATYLSYNYWIWSLYMGSRRTSCFLFEFIHMCKQLLMLDVVSLTLIAQCPEECVCSIWN